MGPIKTLYARCVIATSQLVKLCLGAAAVILLFLIALPCCAQTTNCLQPPPGLTSWWPGDGNAYDFAGTNYGVISGGITFVTGLVGQAFSFDGLHSDVTVPASTSLNVGAGGGLTLEAWINPADTTARPIFEWSPIDSSSYAVNFWANHPNPGAIDAALVDANNRFNSFNIFQSPAGILTTGSFQHVALTYDKASGVARLFLNGAIVAQQNFGTFTPLTSTDLQIGYRVPDAPYGEHSFLGLIDEASLYARALTTNEIQNIFAAGSAGKCKPPFVPPPPPPLPGPVLAPAPSLAWTNPIGGRVFAVDNQTNVYVTVGTKVVLLSAAGLPFQTNSICPLGGVAQRDATGNFYFGGSFDGTQDFGGITLVGGWTNAYFTPGQWWQPGNPTCYLAKYSAAGSLQWVCSFGPQRSKDTLSDILVDQNGGVFAGFFSAAQTACQIAHISSTGGFDWSVFVAQDTFPVQTDPVNLGGLTGSNCCYIAFTLDGYQRAGRVDLNGNLFKAGGIYAMLWTTLTCMNAKPVTDKSAALFEVGEIIDPPPANISTNVSLRKWRTDSSELWREVVTHDAGWTLAGDSAEHVYVAGNNGMVAQFDRDGNLIWSNNFAQPCVGMVVDSMGNRFVSFQDGSIGRLQHDAPAQAPGINLGPQPQTVFVGDSVTMSCYVTGTPPFKFFWQLYGTNLPSASGAVLSLTAVTASQAGPYDVLITNATGSITSSPALLRVKSEELYLGSQLLTNGTYAFLSPPTLAVRSAFASGSSFYSLDGSAPTFSSTAYTGPFVVNHSATVRALGYSADFTQSEEADPVNVVIVETHTLTTTTAGGGSISLSPPGGTYLSTNIVTATAMPASGWSFLYWLGDASGSSSSINVTMDRDKTVRAVFGTTLSTTVVGNGQVQLQPPGGLYPYGTVVQLTAVPQSGNYFGAWGNAASGNVNPFYFVVTNPTPTVSSIFGATPGGQVTLTLMVSGAGRVAASPRANAYTTGQSVTLTATPDAGQQFIGWSGDASGTQNPLTIILNQSSTVNVAFTGRPHLTFGGHTANGASFTLTGIPPSTWQIFGSSNLIFWQSLGWITNNYGQAQFTDPAAASQTMHFYKAVAAP